MSKAEELAKKLGKEIERTVAHDVLMHDALTHLRALEANRQMLVNELEWIRGHIGRYDQPGLPNHIVRRINTALEQAKELT